MRAMEWLGLATGRIRFGPDRRAVREELSDHIETQREALSARHPELTAEEAEERAVAAMGDPEPLARELERLHKPWLGYLWRLSQVLVVLALVATMCVGIWFLVRGDNGELYRYLVYKSYQGTEQFLPMKEARVAETSALLREDKISVGGYTISIPMATLITEIPNLSDYKHYMYIREEPPRRVLYVMLQIDCGLRGEALNLPCAVSRVTDSTGWVYEYAREGSNYWEYQTHPVWGELAPWGQWALLRVYDVPEGVEWVDITFGYGKLERTLRIDLTEEVLP